MKRLENKVAVIYGDGTVGGAIAKSFAKEGANIFLTGRTLKKMDAICDENNWAFDFNGQFRVYFIPPQLTVAHNAFNSIPAFSAN